MFRSLTRARLPASQLVQRLRVRQVTKTLLPALNVAMNLRMPSTSSLGAARCLSTSDMFCFQCEQTKDTKGCDTVGVCGKTPQTAALQDLLVHLLKSIAAYAAPAAREGRLPSAVNHYYLEAMFSTLTNVNFDPLRIQEYIAKGVAIRDMLATESIAARTPVTAIGSFDFGDVDDIAALEQVAHTVGIPDRQARLGKDIVGLQEMATYGLKGALAYAHHAHILGCESPHVYTEAWNIMETIADDNASVNTLLGAVLKVGEINLEVLGMLDKAHNDTLGTPEPTSVPTIPVEGKCILVSGHDLHDLKALLDQVNGTDINVYTHGEMLPAHSYPAFKKYKNLVGHYGGPWQLQKFEFNEFPGAIVMTSNCIIEPRKSYIDRIFTRSVVGFPGVKHLDSQDFSSVIACAKACEGFSAEDVEDGIQKPLLTGFGHKTVLSIADKVVGAVKSGAISHFFLIGGCDGSEGERSYFRDLAKQSPKSSVLLTLGCGKFRLNRLQLGDIEGIPRVLDMGQCNDAYSAVQVAVALANAFDTDVNGLPLSFAISWFEQKAVAVLCTLLHLGIKNIRLGPNLPGFATPAMIAILQEKYNLAPITTAKEDLPNMLQGR